MWEQDNKEVRAWKNWCFQTEVLETILESPLDSKEIKPVNLKGNLPWILFGRTNAESEVPILWPPDQKSANSWFFRKDPEDGKDWKEKATEDEMVGWHHWFNGLELGQTLGDGEGQGSLMCCSPLGSEELTWLGNWITKTDSHIPWDTKN